MNLRIAVLIPCYNEVGTIAAVVHDFCRYLHGADIYVFDNNSVDGTAKAAAGASANVRHVALQGKGNVVRCMFADVDADIYVLVDGDGTYESSYASLLVETLVDGRYDMVVGARTAAEHKAYRFGHRFGNGLLTKAVRVLFGSAFTDMLSGYRVFSRRFVKSFPAEAAGFEVETEFAIHALRLRLPTKEVLTPYAARPLGSSSKLRTYRDGARIMLTILRLFKAERPLWFFSLCCVLCVVISSVLAIPLFETYWTTGLVPRFPTAILCAGLVMLGAISLACGFVLDTVTQGRNEIKRLAYLAIPPMPDVVRAPRARVSGEPVAVSDASA
jgi:glycosyltransferase involved in cell wall biosynthesis